MPSKHSEAERYFRSWLHQVQPKERLLFVTGTRADWGKLEPLAKAAAEAGYLTDFFVTGMHMLEDYGMTKAEIHEFGRSLGGAGICEYVNHRPGDDPTSILAKTILGLRDLVQQEKPDMLIVHGDRLEAFAACTVSAQLSLRCAHIEGGEVSGSIDEQYRHCNSKLSTYHFVSSETAKRRVLSFGEDPSTIFNIGSPELDAHIHESGVTITEVKERYTIPFTEYGIVTFHSVTSETETIGAQAEGLFDCLTDSGKNFVVIFPNNDPGTEKIRDVIMRLDPNHFHCVPSLSFNHFSTLMKDCKAVIGNSSAGVRETPFLGIPSLNVGTRQHNRAEKAASITHASAFDKATIRQFLDLTWGKSFAPDYGFGRGNAAQDFVDALGSEEFWQKDLQKCFYEQR
ncbi:UDP-N-acetylglucosamine 2-epimerase [Mycena crocata]|nr:UDP-N-acetylglucosamine 2-epimerase [Mycena crocata]